MARRLKRWASGAALALVAGAAHGLLVRRGQLPRGVDVADFWGLLFWALLWGVVVWLARQKDSLPQRGPVAAAAFSASLLAALLPTLYAHLGPPLLALGVVAMVFAWLPLVSDWSLSPVAVERRSSWGLLRPRHVAVCVFVLATTWVFVLSWRKHLWFGSAGKDLGLFHQSVWLLSRFEAPHNTVLGMHAFADHLELIDVVAAPLQWLWPDPGALLLFQALLLGAGAAAVFDIARRKLASLTAGVVMAAAYLCAVDIQNAAMFDWNPTTCAAGLLPYVVWSFERERPWGFAAAVVAVALCKENLVLYALGLCLALSFSGRRRRAFWAAALLAVVFVVEMKLVFPLFRPLGFRHLRYEQLGGSAGEIALSVLRAPSRAIALLATPIAKLDGLLSPLSSVAFLCLLAPEFLVALAPEVLERFWSTHTNRWWGYHYGAGAAALSILGTIVGLSRWLSKRPEGVRPRLATAAALLVLLSSALVALTVRGGSAPLFAWRHPYATSAADKRDAEAVLAVIPKDGKVAAQNHLIPHLSARHYIYELYRPITADWVAIDFLQGPWPFDKAYLEQLAGDLVAAGWAPAACRGEAVVLARHAERTVSCPRLGQLHKAKHAGGL